VCETARVMTSSEACLCGSTTTILLHSYAMTMLRACVYAYVCVVGCADA